MKKLALALLVVTGLLAPASAQTSLSAKWAVAFRAVALERLTLAYCRHDASTCTPAARRFINVIEVARRAAAVSERAVIGVLNRQVNLAIRPVSDQEQYGALDVWASPLTTFTSMSGDCEDYAIAKYAALLELGVSAEDLRLVVVSDSRWNSRSFHAVTLVRLAGHWLVLDNLSDVVADVLDTGYSVLAVTSDARVVAGMVPKIRREP